MAIFHWKLQTIKRSAGRSAVEVSAYRAGARLRDQRTGVVYDFSRRNGIRSEIILPAGVTPPELDDGSSPHELRARLWSAAEMAETRGNSVVAREVVIALPWELSGDQQYDLGRACARSYVEQFGVAADLAMHPPSPNGDNKNWHCHIMLTTRVLGVELGFGRKTRELDAAQTGGPIIKALRQAWEVLANQHLADAGIGVEIDHRSLADRGILRTPNRHLGPKLTSVVRKLRRRGSALIAEAESIEREVWAEVWQEAPIEDHPAAAPEITAAWLSLLPTPAPDVSVAPLPDASRKEDSRLERLQDVRLRRVPMDRPLPIELEPEEFTLADEAAAWRRRAARYGVRPSGEPVEPVSSATKGHVLGPAKADHSGADLAAEIQQRERQRAAKEQAEKQDAEAEREHAAVMRDDAKRRADQQSLKTADQEAANGAASPLNMPAAPNATHVPAAGSTGKINTDKRRRKAGSKHPRQGKGRGRGRDEGRDP